MGGGGACRSLPNIGKGNVEVGLSNYYEFKP